MCSDAVWEASSWKAKMRETECPFSWRQNGDRMFRGVSKAIEDKHKLLHCEFVADLNVNDANKRHHPLQQRPFIHWLEADGVANHGIVHVREGEVLQSHELGPAVRVGGILVSKHGGRGGGSVLDARCCGFLVAVVVALKMRDQVLVPRVLQLQTQRVRLVVVGFLNRTLTMSAFFMSAEF